MESPLKGFSRFAAVAALGVLAAGCTASGSAVEPAVTQANLSANKLQFAVGTANIMGTAGLNTVVTYRQPSGASAVLLDTPAITGPTGFLVNAPATTTNSSGATVVAAGNDSGTNQISGSQQPVAGVAAAPTSFGTTFGAFAYGFSPVNSTTSGTPSFTIYSQPFYSPTVKYVGGPPAYPNPRDGSYPSGFVGWSQGFTAFDQVSLATGTYALSVNVPSSNAAGITQTAPGTLSSLTLLPLPSGIAFAHAGANGGTVTFTAPAGSTESIAYVYDSTTKAYYSQVVHATGAQSVTIPDNLGIHAYGSAATPTFNVGDKLSVYVASFDYPAYEAGPPTNSSQIPTITGSNGQADVSLSSATSVIY
jgi:hypothetical protein